MTDFHDHLLHAFLDGELSAGERERLARLLDADDGLRRRLTELERVSALLEDVPQLPAPAGLAAGIMRRVTDLPDAKREPVVISGGAKMSKKVLFGLASAAAIVLAVLSYTGFPPGSRGTEATIGAANRYQAPQIAEKDVVLGDTSAQQFLQSETFAQLLKDPAAVKLLSDASVRQALSDAQLVQALRSPSIRAALNDDDAAAALRAWGRYDGALRQTQFIAALRIPAVRAAFADAAFVNAIRSNDLANSLRTPAMAAALDGCGGDCNGLVRSALDDAQVRSALVDNGFAAAVRDPQFAAAVRNQQFIAAIADNQFAMAVRNPALAASLADGQLYAALRGRSFQDALSNAGFAASLSDAQFAQALRNASGLSQH